MRDGVPFDLLLKTYLGDTKGAAADFARRAGTSGATVSRWQAGAIPMPYQIPGIAGAMGKTEDEIHAAVYASQRAKGIVPADPMVRASQLRELRAKVAYLDRLTARLAEAAGIQAEDSKRGRRMVAGAGRRPDRQPPEAPE